MQCTPRELYWQRRGSYRLTPARCPQGGPLTMTYMPAAPALHLYCTHMNTCGVCGAQHSCMQVESANTKDPANHVLPSSSAYVVRHLYVPHKGPYLPRRLRYARYWYWYTDAKANSSAMRRRRLYWYWYTDAKGSSSAMRHRRQGDSIDQLASVTGRMGDRRLTRSATRPPFFFGGNNERRSRWCGRGAPPTPTRLPASQPSLPAPCAPSHRLLLLHKAADMWANAGACLSTWATLGSCICLLAQPDHSVRVSIEPWRPSGSGCAARPSPTSTAPP